MASSCNEPATPSFAPEVVIAAPAVLAADAGRGILSCAHNLAGTEAATSRVPAEPVAPMRAVCSCRPVFWHPPLELAGALCVAAGGHRDLCWSQSRSADPDQRGNWRDFLALIVLGLAVDLRWLEPAWPAGLTAMAKILLLDAGIFGFLAVRRLDGVGFDLRLRRSRSRASDCASSASMRRLQSSSV